MTFRHPLGFFSLSRPADWKPQDHSGDGACLAYHLPVDGFTSVQVFAKIPESACANSVEKAIDAARRAFAALPRERCRMRREQTTLQNGTTLETIVVEHLVDFRAPDGSKHDGTTLDFVFLGSPCILLVFVFEAKPSKRASLQASRKRVLESVRLRQAEKDVPEVWTLGPESNVLGEYETCGLMAFAADVPWRELADCLVSSFQRFEKLTLFGDFFAVLKSRAGSHDSSSNGDSATVIPEWNDTECVARLKKAYSTLRWYRTSLPQALIIFFMAGCFETILAFYLPWAIPLEAEMGKEAFSKYLEENGCLNQMLENRWSLFGLVSGVLMTLLLCAWTIWFYGPNAGHRFRRTIAALEKEFPDEISVQGSLQALREPKDVVERILVLSCHKDQAFLKAWRERNPILTAVHRDHVIDVSTANGLKVCYDGREMKVTGWHNSYFEVMEHGELAHYRISNANDQVWRNGTVIDLSP